MVEMMSNGVMSVGQCLGRPDKVAKEVAMALVAAITSRDDWDYGVALEYIHQYAKDIVNEKREKNA